MGLYKGTTKINEVYLGDTQLVSVFNSNSVMLSPLNIETYVWLLEDVVRHRKYVWKDNKVWDDSLTWTEPISFKYSAFGEYGSDMVDGLDTTGLMSDVKLKTTDVLYK